MEEHSQEKVEQSCAKYFFLQRRLWILENYGKGKYKVDIWAIHYFFPQTIPVTHLPTLQKE